MAYFDINIFGTLHTHHNPDLFTFNLHVLQVESDIVPTNFDMFIEFYAFPFNFGGGVGSVLTANYIDPALFNSTPQLTNRFSVGKPQVIHLTALTPSTVIDLYDCNPGQYPNPNSCTNNQTNTFFPLPTPCPNPEDIRLFSGTFSVPINGGLDGDWTDMINSSSGNKSFTPNVGSTFSLPLNITIIADGCRYLNKKSSANIYTDYSDSYQADPQPYGNVDCLFNPKFYPIGYKDKIRVT